jgi:CBS domain-containing protein
MKVSELMTAPAVTCRPDDTLACAAQHMWDHDCGGLPVVNSDGCLIGFITDRDICMAAWTQGCTLHSIPVATAMSKQILACRAHDSVDAVRRTMREKRIRRVPIVDDANRPVGLISMNDLARQSAGSGKSEREVLQTLASIGEPRLARPLDSARTPGLVGATAATAP